MYHKAFRMMLFNIWIDGDCRVQTSVDWNRSSIFKNTKISKFCSLLLDLDRVTIICMFKTFSPFLKKKSSSHLFFIWFICLYFRWYFMICFDSRSDSHFIISLYFRDLAVQSESLVELLLQTLLLYFNNFETTWPDI